MVGHINSTYDMAYASQVLLARTAIVIGICEEESLMTLPPSPELICGAVLLPPLPITQDLLDGDKPINLVMDDYITWLHNRDQAKFIAQILALLIKGHNVLLLGLNANSLGMTYDFILRGIDQYFQTRYGIMIGTQTMPDMWASDAYFSDFMYEDLYLYGMMDAYTLLSKWSDVSLSDEVVKKMVFDIPRPVQTGTLEEYKAIYNQLKHDIQHPPMPFVFK